MTPTDASQTMLLQQSFKDMRQRFTAAGDTAAAELCRSQERALIRDNRLSPEMVGYARQCAARLREKGLVR